MQAYKCVCGLLVSASKLVAFVNSKGGVGKGKISELETYVRERPTRVVMVGFGLGVVLGLYVRR
jgi:hypothetical protein